MSLRRVLVALDQLGNAVIGGYEDESISARAWRNRHQRAWGRARRLIDALFFWEPAHCRQSYEYERLRMGAPVEQRIHP